MEVLNNDKVIQKFSMDKIDWCGIMKDGKVPKAPVWKFLMAGFGRQISKYSKCPLKGNIAFENFYPDRKMMLFVPKGKMRVFLTGNAFSENGKKDYFNLTVFTEIFDE